MNRLAVPLLLAAGAAVLAPGAARAAQAFDASGMLFTGTEVLPGIGESGVSIHFAADGTAAGSFADLTGLARDWSGDWFAGNDGTISLLLDPVGEQNGDFLAVQVSMSASGKGKGTVTRNQAPQAVTSSVKVRAVFPARKPKGWTTVVPRIRDTGALGAGEFRGTLVLRNLALPKKKPKPLLLEVFAVAPNGLPGIPVEVSLLPGAMARLEGGALPHLPAGSEETAFQIVVAGGKGFDPALVEVLAIEEVLRSADPAVPTAGTALPVRWVRGLSAAAASRREEVPLAAPWFRDDGGAGALPRDAVLVLRDLAPFAGGAPAGSVRVSVRTLDGTEAASAEVDLPPGAAVEVRPRDLLASPGDLPGDEGQIRVTRTDGTDLPRDSVAAALLSTATSSGVPAATVSHAVGFAEPEGPSAPLVLPWFRLPDDDGASEMRLELTNLADGPTTVAVAVSALDGTALFTGNVPVGARSTARADPVALGMDPALLPGGEGQIRLGPPSGLPRHLFLAHAEMRLSGTPDALFAFPVGFEAAPATAEPFRILLADATETGGSAAGGADSWILVRNGGIAAAALTVHALDEAGTPVGSSPDVSVTVAAGESKRISVEEVLALAGATLTGPGDAYRGPVEVLGTGPAALAASSVRFLYGADFPGGVVLPTPVR